MPLYYIILYRIISYHMRHFARGLTEGVDALAVGWTGAQDGRPLADAQKTGQGALPLSPCGPVTAATRASGMNRLDQLISPLDRAREGRLASLTWHRLLSCELMHLPGKKKGQTKKSQRTAGPADWPRARCACGMADCRIGHISFLKVLLRETLGACPLAELLGTPAAPRSRCAMTCDLAQKLAPHGGHTLSMTYARAGLRMPWAVPRCAASCLFVGSSAPQLKRTNSQSLRAPSAQSAFAIAVLRPRCGLRELPDERRPLLAVTSARTPPMPQAALQGSPGHPASAPVCPEASPCP